MTERSAFSWLALTGLWAVTLATALWWRPLLPVDETRYVGVAWEMWLRGDFLVPYQNGATYSHKPPLLFWLMHAGWAVFGVNEWWPRLIAPLIGLLNLVLVTAIARSLWPDDKRPAQLVPWLLFGSLFWLFFETLVQFDLLLVSCTLASMLGILRAAAGERLGWWVLGLALAAGVLVKGPVILLHALPVVLLAPVWLPSRPRWGWAGWYLLALFAVLIGAALALLWAIPAGIEGGKLYRDAIFWGQTAHRVVDSFAHREPWWWYFPLLPLLLLPWLLWSGLWRSLAQSKQIVRDWQGRFLLCWIIPVLIAFSLVSGKQLKYLLPMLPAIMLWLAVLLARGIADSRRRPIWGVSLVLLFGAGVLLLMPVLAPDDWPQWLRDGSLPGAAVLGAAAFVAPLLRLRGALQPLMMFSAAGVLLFVVVHATLVRAAAPAYNTRVLAERIHAVQERGHPVANVSQYHGQFHFTGRLTQPLAQVWRRQARQWANAHRKRGYLITYTETPPEGAQLVVPYRGEYAALWKARAYRRWINRRRN